MVDRVEDTDVLIVGGGVAGIRAGLEAADQGAEVLLVTKGLLGKSCCSVEAQMFLCPPRYVPPDSLNRHLKQRVESYGGYMIDQENERRALASASKFMRELESLGLYWRRYPDGEFVLLERNAIASKHGDTGKNIMQILTQEFRRRAIPFREDTAVTSLLTRGRNVVGATAISYANGDILAIQAKSVIMATGPGGWLWTYSTAPRTVTGDGLVMACRAGAELTNIEFNLWHMSDHVRIPGTKPSRACFRQNLGPSITPRGNKTMWAPIWLNAKGERFMEQWEKSLGGLKHEQALAVVDQIRKGNATPTSGIYASLRHVSPEDLERYLYLWRWLKKLGIDTTKSLIEVGMCAHWMIGGLKANTRFETTVPGLYAAGGVTSGATSLAECLHSGVVSAKYASDRAKRRKSPVLRQTQIEKEETRILKYLRTDPVDGFSPGQVKEQIRQIMWEKMHYIKNEQRMKEGLEALRRVREDIVPKMRLASMTKRFCYGWVESLDTINMLDLAELIIKASLMRKESRKQFQRSDYPQTDDENWMKTIAIRHKDQQMKTRVAPVELPYVKPGDEHEQRG
jgi:succinate dehydrogenase/fumarate reductase flavoprotein subunit